MAGYYSHRMRIAALILAGAKGQREEVVRVGGKA